MSCWDYIPEWIYDDGYDAEYDGYQSWGKPQGPVSKTCLRCGVRGLSWGVNARGDWRLFDDVDKQHVCHENTEDDFTALD